ncbi:MAG: hypothetical protein OXI66_07150 [Boseongicola sp.]|nr:hypothetical protein [Boseongicola sp.]MYI67224.1 hypothetical protein [Boseongicola sp. SB0673_bin_14]
MSVESEAAEALRLISEAGFKTGPGWDRAHQIAQAHEGEAIFDAIHALLHRIEGDLFNASYWDRRAETDLGQDGFAVEAERLRAMLKAGAAKAT